MAYKSRTIIDGKKDINVLSLEDKQKGVAFISIKTYKIMHPCLLLQSVCQTLCNNPILNTDVDVDVMMSFAKT